ncbi:MAG TPA: MFS transporter [Ktedonobacteraceae bacterium]
MARRSVAPLLIGTFLLRSNSSATTITLGLLLAHISTHSARPITSLQVGLIPVVFYISELTLSPCFGMFSDRVGRRFFLITGPLFGLIEVYLLAFTPYDHPLSYLLGLQVLAGLAGAMTTPVALGYLADFTMNNQKYRARMMSLYELATSGGIAAGVVLGGLAWQHLERRAFIAFATVYLFVAFCMWLTPVVDQVMDRRGLRSTLHRYGRIIRTPRLFIFIPAWICISALVGIWLGSQPTFVLSTPLHYHTEQLLMGIFSGPNAGRSISLIMGAAAFFFGVGLLFWGFFLNRVSRLRLMLLSVGGIYVACIALWGLNHGGVASEGLMICWFLLLLAGIFAETGFAPAALSYLADISEDAAKDRGLVMGLYSVFLGVGEILGNGVGGIFAHQFGFDGLIYLTALLGCIALISLLWLFWYDRERIGRQDILYTS